MYPTMPKALDAKPRRPGGIVANPCEVGTSGSKTLNPKPVMSAWETVASVYNGKRARSDILPRVPWLVISPKQGL